MTYQQQLQTPQWIAKRLQIFKRDKFLCRVCQSKTSIQVHHIIYVDGKMCWQYPNSLLITLCSACHKKQHTNFPTIVVSGKSLSFKINKKDK